MTKKMGRPTDKPKPYKITTRIDEQSKQVLNDYCNQEQIAQNEGVRRGINKLKNDIKK